MDQAIMAAGFALDAAMGFVAGEARSCFEARVCHWWNVAGTRASREVWLRADQAGKGKSSVPVLAAPEVRIDRVSVNAAATYALEPDAGFEPAHLGSILLS